MYSRGNYWPCYGVSCLNFVCSFSKCIQLMLEYVTKVYDLYYVPLCSQLMSQYVTRGYYVC